MWSPQACEAFLQHRVLELGYDDYSRWVEVHAVGISTAGHPVMRCWQVRGGSVSDELLGWKLMRLDDASGAFVTDEVSHAPRPGWQRGDKDMIRITCEV